MTSGAPWIVFGVVCFIVLLLLGALWHLESRIRRDIDRKLRRGGDGTADRSES
jgi:hypothetical protein